MSCNSCYSSPCLCQTSSACGGNVCAAITVKSSWNVPSCQSSAVISVPGIQNILAGSYIWNPLYGYFLVQAINTFSGQITIKNECLAGNVPGGSVIPACTIFMISSPPLTSPGASNVSSIFPFVAVDFVAPANSVCVDITVTNVNGFYVGANVQIGGGTYSIGGIPNATTVNICNDGSGITPGTIVSARTTQGLYQYPVTVVDSCCALLTPRVTALEDGLDNLTDWSASVVLTGSGAMTISATVVIYAFWAYIGTNRIWYALKAKCTTGGVASYAIIHTLPHAFSSQAGDGAITAKAIDGGRPLAATASLHNTDSTHMEIAKYDSSNYALGADRYIFSGGVYEI